MELDGTLLRVPITRKRVKIFKKWSDVEPYLTLRNTDTEEQADMDHEGAESEESGLKLIVDIMGELESAMDEER